MTINPEMTTPAQCSVDKPREAVVLMVDFEAGGVRKQERIAVDYRCLIADSLPRAHAGDFARLAERYMDDPVIKTLVERAKGIPVGSPTEEAERLKQWIGFDQTKWIDDPGGFWAGLRVHAIHLTNPSETLWLGGGCCNDYAPMIAAWLALRGVPGVYSEWAVGHVWTSVKRASDAQMIHLDYAPGVTSWDPMDTAQVRPAARPSGAKPPLPDDVVHFVPESLLPPANRTTP